MTYRVEFTTAAARQLRKTMRPDAVRIAAAIRALANEPRPQGSKPLAGRPGWRIRIGDFRVLYEIDDAVITVRVVRVGNRRDVYR